MKLLMGMPAPDSWGGPAASEPPFVEALRGLGADVTEEVYVYGDKERPTPFPARVRRVVATALRFRRLLRTGRFDVVHLNTAFDLKTILRDSFSLFVMRPRRGARIFLKFHGSEAQEFLDAGPSLRRLIGYIARRADGFGVHTSDELENFRRLGFDPDKFRFVRNAVTIAEHRPEGFERLHRLPEERFELLFVGRFVPGKCLLETIAACRLLKQRGVRFALTAVGDGPTRAEAEALVREQGLGEEISFTGYLPEEEVAGMFYSRDILLFPTRYGEGFPNVFFKALAAGMPIVATEFRAARDFLRERRHYLACRPEPEGIAAAVAELIGDRELRRSMSAANLEYGRGLRPASVAAEYLEIYEELRGGVTDGPRGAVRESVCAE